MQHPHPTHNTQIQPGKRKPQTHSTMTLYIKICASRKNTSQSYTSPPPASQPANRTHPGVGRQQQGREREREHPTHPLNKQKKNRKKEKQIYSISPIMVFPPPPPFQASHIPPSRKHNHRAVLKVPLMHARFDDNDVWMMMRSFLGF